ncbi:hypothetical protein BN1195_00327 [Chryseobacterium oranimense G311]|uniref:hypothetical protein n=1 Tax=Chryseobacterium oranimense TaxID=421058 RepID=UPI0005338406|nr:hypothetical protein [Chryseobacterium oranimense]CEJ68045.1 hypothetical protein BN1195_00327 [Chryseobacterium oranimense G311]
MVGIRLIIEKNKKEKILSEVKEISFFKNLKNEKIENYKIKNTIVWEFEIEQDILTNHILSIFSNHWIITLDDDKNIASAISENRIKLEGLTWVNLELY